MNQIFQVNLLKKKELHLYLVKNTGKKREFIN